MSVRLLLSCVHLLELGLDLGNSLNCRGESERTRVAELPKEKQRLILNDIHISLAIYTVIRVIIALEQMLIAS